MIKEEHRQTFAIGVLFETLGFMKTWRSIEILARLNQTEHYTHKHTMFLGQGHKRVVHMS